MLTCVFAFVCFIVVSCLFVSLLVYTHTYLFIYKYKYIYIYLFTFYVCVSMYKVYNCTYISNMYIYICAYIYIYTHTHKLNMHACMHACNACVISGIVSFTFLFRDRCRVSVLPSRAFD